MSDSEVRPMTNSDVVELVASRSQWQPGDYIEPLVDGERIVLQVVERHDRDNWFFGASVYYVAEGTNGSRYEVWRMDDPRSADADQIAAFVAARESNARATDGEGSPARGEGRDGR